MTNLAVGVPILLVLSWIQIGPPTIHVLTLVPALLTLVCWTAGLTVLAATATVFRRDLKHAMPLILRVLFIVITDHVPHQRIRSYCRADLLLSFITVVIESIRDGVLRHQWPTGDS